ncbi:hypothetical protein BDV96DRAFT_183078 [Lophiotrema nucula]|uniref:RING-type domain-containing protein n=1 Tax=Lophiotrema nucula TaxID=690887 RepID=A0A6A5YZC7_9PLEO|nr:hypothetical protein BDV96DRAFT_183078 [Lophiotrema nucula]
MSLLTRRSCYAVTHTVRIASSINLYTALTDSTRNHFPFRCWKEGCGMPIQISDLRKCLSSQQLDDLLKASLKQYIRANLDFYAYCRTPDCPSIYSRTDSDSSTIHTCYTCLTQTCTHCGIEPHLDITCDTHQAMLKSSAAAAEQSAEEYIKVAANNTKKCPKCKALLEKTEGCNHIQCRVCTAHLCWVCLQTFVGSGAAYVHVRDDHWFATRALLLSGSDK